MKFLATLSRLPRPEMQFMLRVLQPDSVGAGSVEDPDSVGVPDTQELDWEYLVAFAFRHRLLPVVHTRLGTIPDLALPDAVRESIRERTAAISRNNLLLASELLHIISAMEEEGVPVLPFKGAPLAMRLYGSVAARFFTDNDILVHPEHVQRAWRTLGALGYEPRPRLTPAQIRIYPRYEHDIGMWQIETNAHAELHWCLFDRGIVFDLGKEFWKRLERQEFLGTDIPAMPAEELLVMLAVHGGKHGWSQLGWAYDVAQLLASEPKLDWGRATELAANTGCLRMLHLAVRLAADLFGANVAAHVAQAAAADQQVGLLTADVMERIFVNDDDTFTGRPAQRFYLASRERAIDRLHYLWHWAVTPNARDRYGTDLPPALAFLYYGIRPFRRLATLLGRKRAF